MIYSLQSRADNCSLCDYDGNTNITALLYEVFDKETNEIVKVGVSGGKISKYDKSYRATKQVNKWNKEVGYDKFDSRIIDREPAGENARSQILKAEENRCTYLKENNLLKKSNYHQRP